MQPRLQDSNLFGAHERSSISTLPKVLTVYIQPPTERYCRTTNATQHVLNGLLELISSFMIEVCTLYKTHSELQSFIFFGNTLSHFFPPAFLFISSNFLLASSEIGEGRCSLLFSSFRIFSPCFLASSGVSVKMKALNRLPRTSGTESMDEYLRFDSAELDADWEKARRPVLE